MKNQAFTLVELIVVVTILAILATIGFVSYSGYLTGVRDTNRIASLTAISDGLELYRTRNDLPDPDEAIDIQIESKTIAHQGYVGSNVLQTIEYSKAGKDPKDDSYYSYYLTDDKKHYQLMAFLEESDNLESRLQFSQSSPLSQREGINKNGASLSSYEAKEYKIGVGKVYAATSYKNRYPKVYGKKLGILINSDNTPVQEIESIKSTGKLNFSGSLSEIYTAVFTDNKSKLGSGKSVLAGIISASVGKNNQNCKEILLKNPLSAGVDGEYSVVIKNQHKKVYCDMMTNGGGWTLIDTKIRDEKERIEVVRFIQDTGYDFGAPITDICLECGNFPQYIRNSNEYKTLEFICKYRLDLTNDIADIGYMINDSLEYHEGRDGLFIAGSNGGLSNFGLRSEGEHDYRVYEEIYCR